MSRSTRLLAALGAIALAGLGALSYLARQYEKRVHTPAVVEGEGSRAARLVGAFLAAGGVESPGPQVLAGAGITPQDYASVRSAAVRWAASGRLQDTALAAALDARAGEVRAALGR